MDTVLLTTDTLHHRFFAARVHERFPWKAIVLETNRSVSHFETEHPFEVERERYETEKGYAEMQFTASEGVCEYPTANDSCCVKWLETLAPEVVIVFGTSRLESHTINVPSKACLNLHGGNPEYYRGLDSHLWAIYHSDFKNIVTTLHHVDSSLDTGDVVMQTGLTFPSQSQLYELRSINTLACVQMTCIALEVLMEKRKLPRRNQVQRGRYYSMMPSVLKQICHEKFSKYTAA